MSSIHTDSKYNDNSFKEEHHLSSPMTHENIGIKINHGSVVTTLPTLPIKESRLPYSFKIRKSIYKSATKYRGLSGMNWREFLERSLIQYMEVNPIDGLLVMVNSPENRKVNRDDRMLDIICVGEVESFIKEVKPLVEQGCKLHKSKAVKLFKILNKSKKIKNMSNKLDKLLDEALEYVA